MKVGVIEIMPKGHYTLVESVAKIFASDPNNEVIIYTTKIGVENTLFIKEEYNNVHIIDVEKEYGLQAFISKINQLQLDRAYLITLDHYIKEFANIQYKFPFHVFIHNIYLWFDLSFTSNLERTWKEILDKPALTHYWIKRNFIQSATKKKLTNRVLKSGGKFVVLNGNLRTELERFTASDTIEEIPFSIYQPKLIDKSSDDIFRICVPGMLSVSRRDYFSVFKMMREYPEIFKTRVIVDLLGGVNISESGDQVLVEAKQMVVEGYKVLFYDKSLVAIDEFDEELSKSDIVLGNMHVVMNEFNIYGKSKDSGIMYTMVKTAKPGFLPAGYSILPELKDSTLIFSTYEELGLLIKNLIDDKDKLALLKQKAKVNSGHFSPEKVYKRLINKN